MKQIIKRTKKRDESGMVSFLITLIMLAVITLIVIGFTQVANRNRRQALDRQLSTQAFYAAESGINQAVNYIKMLPVGTTAPVKNYCGTGAAAAADSYSFTDSKLNTDGSVQTTCLLVNGYPTSVQTTANVGGSVVIPIIPVDSSGNPTNATSLTFTWTSHAASADASGCSSTTLGTFASSHAPNCTYGLLRVDLMQFNQSATTVNPLSGAQDMANTTVTLYMQPLTAGSAKQPLQQVDFGTATASYIIDGHCSNTQCAASFRLPSTPNHAYYARLTTLYSNAPNVTVTGLLGSNYVNFAGQYLIDATGRAQDVVRRVAVRYNPSSGTSSVDPISAIQTSGDICKRLTVVSNTDVSNDATCTSP